jgi:hypothetical protein
VLDFDARHTGRVHCTRGLDSLPGEVHPGQVGERAAGPDDLRAAPVADREVGAQRLTHVAAQPAHSAPELPSALLGTGPEVLLGEADGA